jgi:dTDP-4-dehydrorhamnose 3,5-epimerase
MDDNITTGEAIPTLFMRDCYKDERGEIYTIWKAKEDIPYAEDKVSISKRDVIRGFHGDDCTDKLITCLYGEVLLKVFNPRTLGRWHFKLSAWTTEKSQVYVPAGLLNAHLCLSATCVFHYKITAPYGGPDSQWSVRFDDPDMGFVWPGSNFILSERDKKSGSLQDLRKRLYA